jgi:hypothetical protein
MANYFNILNKGDLYEIAVSSNDEGIKILFINFYESGGLRPKEIPFDQVPESVVTKLLSSMNHET